MVRTRRRRRPCCRRAAGGTAQHAVPTALRTTFHVVRSRGDVGRCCFGDHRPVSKVAHAALSCGRAITTGGIIATGSGIVAAGGTMDKAPCDSDITRRTLGNKRHAFACDDSHSACYASHANGLRAHHRQLASAGRRFQADRGSTTAEPAVGLVCVAPSAYAAQRARRGHALGSQPCSRHCAARESRGCGGAHRVAPCDNCEAISTGAGDTAGGDNAELPSRPSHISQLRNVPSQLCGSHRHYSLHRMPPQHADQIGEAAAPVRLQTGHAFWRRERTRAPRGQCRAN
jgi:hypothetical protein